MRTKRSSGAWTASQRRRMRSQPFSSTLSRSSGWMMGMASPPGRGGGPGPALRSPGLGAREGPAQVGDRPVAVDAAALLLAHQAAVGGEHGVEVEGAEEGVVARVEAD